MLERCIITGLGVGGDGEKDELWKDHYFQVLNGDDILFSSRAALAYGAGAAQLLHRQAFTAIRLNPRWAGVIKVGLQLDGDATFLLKNNRGTVFEAAFPNPNLDPNPSPNPYRRPLSMCASSPQALALNLILSLLAKIWATSWISSKNISIAPRTRTLEPHPHPNSHPCSSPPPEASSACLSASVTSGRNGTEPQPKPSPARNPHPHPDLEERAIDPELFSVDLVLIPAAEAHSLLGHFSNSTKSSTQSPSIRRRRRLSPPP